MNSPWKLILLLSGIFLAGVVTGGFVTQRHVRKEFSKRFVPEQWCPTRFDLLTKQLELTPDQQAKLKPIIKRDMDDLVRTRNNTMRETRRIIERMDHDIAEVLTPAQRIKFDQLNIDKRENLKRFLKGSPPGRGDKRFRPEGEEPPPGPPPSETAPDKPAGEA